MAADGKAFATSLGINAAICLIVFFFFGFFRRSRYTRKYYAPKRFMSVNELGHKKPRRLPNSFFGWIFPVYSASEEEIIEVAGIDQAMYLRVCQFGAELFWFVSFWCLVSVLPVNITGSEVDALQALNASPAGVSNFTYWIPPPPPPAPNAPPAPLQGKQIKPPNFFNDSIPPAPPGLTWWKYSAGVPPLPNPDTILGSNYSDFQWMYNSEYVSNSYTFSNLDLTTMSNVSPSSPRFWVHFIAVWVVSLYCYKLLWRYTVEAVALRIRYLTNTKKGAESHSVLVQDIPGTNYGTMYHRLDNTALKYCPKFIKDKVKQGVMATVDAGKKGLDMTAGRLEKTMLPGGGGPTSSPAYSPREDLAPNIMDSGAGSDPNMRRDLEGLESVRPPVATLRRATTDADAVAKALRVIEDGTSLPEFVEKEMREIYVDQVDAVNCVYDTTVLDPLVAEYDKLMGALTDLLDDYTSKQHRKLKIKRKQTTVLGATLGPWGKEKYGLKPKKVDALEWYVDRMTELRARILEEQTAAKSKFTSSAFVTFKSRETQVIASTSMQHHDQRFWHVEAAAAPGEVVWRNIRFRSWERSSRTTLIWFAFTMLCLFYLIPIGVIQAMIEIDRLEKIPVFKQLVSVPFIRSLLTAILPSLVLKIFLALLPALLSFMNRKQGFNSESKIDFNVVYKFTIFQIFAVFFGSFIVGSFFSQFDAWIKNPGQAITLLGTAAPLTSIFFMNYLVLSAFSAKPITFIRIPGLVMFQIFSKIAGTQRAKNRLWQNQEMKFGDQVTDHVMTVLLGLTFCAICPIITPIALIYFLINIIIIKYQALYVFREPFQTGGRLWHLVFEQIVWCLFIFQLIMLALLGIKKAAAPSLLIIPLLIMTLVFRNMVNSLFRKPLEILSMRAAADLDLEDKVEEQLHPLSEAEQKATDEMYLSPAFKFNEEEFSAVMQETADMDATLKGEKVVDLEAVAAEKEKTEAAEAAADDDDDYEEAFEDARSTVSRSSSHSVARKADIKSSGGAENMV